MDADDIQALINLGYGLGAQFLGRSASWYRPFDPTRPAISDLTLQGSILLRVDPNPSFNASRPMQYGKPVLYGLYDRTNTLPGDYLVSDQGTYLIASQENLNPALLVQCNTTVTITRPSLAYPNHDPSMAYAGAPGSDTVILQQFPASLLDKSRGEKGPVGLALDAQKIGTYEMLLPILPGSTIIMTNDYVIDQQGNRYSVSAPESSPLGWRVEITSETA